MAAAKNAKKKTGAKKPRAGKNTKPPKTSRARSGSSKKPETKKNAAPARDGAPRGAETERSGRILGEDRLGAVIAAACAVLLLLIAVIPGGDGSFWESLRGVFFGVFGIAGFVMPVLLFIAAVVITLGKNGSSVLRFVCALLFSFLVASIVFLHGTAVSSVIKIDVGRSVREAFLYYINSGSVSSGAVGALIGSGLLALTRAKLPAYCLVIFAAVAALMLFFGVTLKRIFTAVRESGERRRIAAADARAARAAEREALKASAPQPEADSSAAPDARKETKKDKTSQEKKREDEIRRAEAFIDEVRTAAGKTPANVDASPDAEVPSIFSRAVRGQKKTESPAADPDAPVIHTATGFMPTGEDVRKANEEAAKLAEAQGLEDEPENKKGRRKKGEGEALPFEVEPAEETPVDYVRPPMSLLRVPPPASEGTSPEELVSTGEKLIKALDEYGVSAKVSDIVPGASVTRYELTPAPGVKINKFTNLSDDLAMRLAAPSGLRIEAPIPNKAAIGIEIPNKNRRTVMFREVIEDPAYAAAVEKGGKLVVGLGKDIAGSGVFCNLADMPHLLVAGTTGSGKSVCLNTMILSLLYNADPDEVKIILVDPKKVEFSVYNGMPHLLVPVVSDPRMAAGALGWAVTEMLRRYKMFDDCKVRDLKGYNVLRESEPDRELEKIPQIVIIIDELADLMVVAQNDVENSIMRLAQMARAAGMHLVIATQRPSVDVLTGVIKANIPSRIALSVSSQIDSRTILDQGGAEKLMGYGDMLLLPLGKSKPVRLQGAYLSDAEISDVVSFIRAQGGADYSEQASEEMLQLAAAEKSEQESPDTGIGITDELEKKAIEFCMLNPEKASISGFQRSLGMGFAKAGRLMDTLEAKGFVGPAVGSKPRKVLITREQWYEMNSSGASAPRPVEPGPDNEEE
ncbi:MAG: DNA translocase FtsK [Clostridia bacterium]|nr:DNA translocase FtsK [Clostridia bacterium]